MKPASFFTFFFLLSGTLFLPAQAPYRNVTVNIADAQVAPVILHPGEYVPNQLLVMVQPGVVIGELEEKFSENNFTVVAAQNISKSMRVWVLTFANGTVLEDALKTAKSFPEIQLAQYNHYSAHRANIPNDPDFSQQWNMNNTGQTGGIPDADIDAPEAWDITTGGLTVQGDTIVVAVIDDGFDITHNDLTFLKNYADTPGDSIDNDGNGYIDDYDGWNAYDTTGNISPALHGTHVSGIIGAKGNNSIGVAGVNWNVKIMPVMGSDGTEGQVVNAYTYVMDARRKYNQTNGAQGAFVVATNSSFGVDGGQPSQYPIWCAMYDSMGVVGILSAGATANHNWNIDSIGDIPTACPSDFMISVTNTMNNDVKNANAAYGPVTIDIGAPGTFIESTIPGNSDGTLTGTSMASPHVAGAVGLMYAAACPQLITACRTKPDSVALLMKSYLLNSVDHVPSLQGEVSSNGRLNLFNAVSAVQSCNWGPASVVGSQLIDFSLNNIFPNPANNYIDVRYSVYEQSSVFIQITDILGQPVLKMQSDGLPGSNVQRLDVSGLADGIYFVQLKCGQKVSVVKRVVISR